MKLAIMSYFKGSCVTVYQRQCPKAVIHNLILVMQLTPDGERCAQE